MFRSCAFLRVFAAAAILGGAGSGAALAAPGGATPIDAVSAGYPVLLPNREALEIGGRSVLCGDVSLAVAAGLPQCVRRLTRADVSELRRVGAAGLASGQARTARLPSGTSVALVEDENGNPAIASADMGEGVMVALGTTDGGDAGGQGAAPTPTLTAEVGAAGQGAVPSPALAADVNADIPLAERGRLVWLRLIDANDDSAVALEAPAATVSTTVETGGIEAGATVGGESGITASASVGGESGGIGAGATVGGESGVTASASVGGESGGIGVGASVGGASLGVSVGG